MKFPLVITLEFNVSYFENKSDMTDQEIADFVVDYVEDDRNDLVMQAKYALIHLLAGEIDDL